MTQRLVSYLAGSGGEPLPDALPILMGRKELSPTVATWALGKFALRPIECH
jgi:hypothetical protein